MENECAVFKKNMLSDMKLLVRKRWAEGDPICVCDPMEHIIPYLSQLVNLIEKDKE